MIRNLVLVAAASLALAGGIAPAASQGLVQTGVLECRGGRTVGLVVGSVTEFNCLYNGNVGPQQAYRATVRRLGVDLGFTEGATLVWTVLAPTAQLGLGDLAGNYVGAQANASVGGGLGANALIGGSNNSIALQPLSVQGQAGLNVSAGIASLELRF
jgi:hypothetical protein